MLWADKQPQNTWKSNCYPSSYFIHTLAIPSELRPS